MTNEAAPYTSGALISYGCRNGDLFVSGTVDGRATLAAENYIYIVGNIVYEDAQDDILGLVGNNAIWIWNPVNSGNDSLLDNNGRRVDSALLSVAHTFQVQNYNKGGSRGTLTVNGSIAQKFRGIVKNGSNGYIKNYLYDDRLRYMAPPKYLSPVTTTYGVSVWVEISPVFNGERDAPMIGATIILVTFAGLFGLAIGSFLNVVVWRLPRGESLSSPPSACPKCGHAIRAARQRAGARLAAASRQMPRLRRADLAALPARRGVHGHRVRRRRASSSASRRRRSGRCRAYLYLAAISIALALIDLDTHRLPNRIVLPSLGVGAVLLAARELGERRLGRRCCAPSSARRLCRALLRHRLHLAARDGDGATSSSPPCSASISAGWAGGRSPSAHSRRSCSVASSRSALLIARRARRGTAIPFGPWMIAGAWLGIAGGAALWNTYLGTFGLV